MCPVLNTHAVALEEDALGWRHDPAAAETVRSDVLELLPSRQLRFGGSGNSVRRRRVYPTMQASIQKLHAAGVRIAFGVDAGIPNHFAGFNEHQELEYLVDSGLTPMEAIAAATSVSAEILGLDDRGVLEVGKRADFIVLDESPLDDIRNTRKIAAVYQGGRAIDRDALRRAWLGN